MNRSRNSQRERIHIGRTAGGDRHHWHPDQSAIARRAGGPRGRTAHAMHQQPQAIGFGHPEFPRHQGLSANRHPAARSAHAWRCTRWSCRIWKAAISSTVTTPRELGRSSGAAWPANNLYISSQIIPNLNCPSTAADFDRWDSDPQASSSPPAMAPALRILVQVKCADYGATTGVATPIWPPAADRNAAGFSRRARA